MSCKPTTKLVREGKYVVKVDVALIITDDQTGPLKVKTQQAVVQMMSLRKVIFAKDWLVITDQIAQQMNNEYQN